MTVLDTLRRPAYTGENRCWPCTAVNLGLVVVAAVLAGAALAPLGPIVLLAGGFSVYLRGYLVPGTPRIAPRLVAPLPFDIGPTSHETAASGSIADGAAARGSADEDGSRPSDPDALITALGDAGVLVADGDRFRLTDAYREAFEDRLSELRTLSAPALADRAAAAAAGDFEGDAQGDRILLAGDTDVWLSRAVALAETAAAEALVAFDVAPERRAAAARPLRTLVRTCPLCGGNVSETTLQSCCGGPGTTHRRPHRPVLACEECATVVFEFDAA